MLAKWTQIFPYFVVVWFAKKQCERFDGPTIEGKKGITFKPYKDCVMTIWEKENERT